MRDERRRGVPGGARGRPQRDSSDVQVATQRAATFLVAAADGALDETEVQQLAAAFIDLTGIGLSEHDVTLIIDSYAAALERDGFEARIEQIAGALDPDAARTAFVMACGMAYMDGGVDESEAQVFSTLAAAFGIPNDEAEALLGHVERELLS